MKTRKEIADHLETIATLHQLLDEHPYRARAYRQASNQIQHHEEDFENLVQSGQLEAISGIGGSIAKEITAFLQAQTTTPLMHQLQSQTPPWLLEQLTPTNVSWLRQIHDSKGLIRTSEGFANAWLSGLFHNQTPSIRQKLYSLLEKLHPEALKLSPEPLGSSADIPRLRGLAIEGSIPQDLCHYVSIEFVFFCNLPFEPHPHQMRAKLSLPSTGSEAPKGSLFYPMHKELSARPTPHQIGLIPLDPLFQGVLEQTLVAEPDRCFLLICRHPEQLSIWIQNAEGLLAAHRHRILNFFSREACLRIIRSRSQEL